QRRYAIRGRPWTGRRKHDIITSGRGVRHVPGILRGEVFVMPYITRNGVKVYYQSMGSGPAIVFLHPWSTNRYIWTFQLMHFARNHRCIAVDHRGHGQSDKPASGYAIGEMA